MFWKAAGYGVLYLILFKFTSNMHLQKQAMKKLIEMMDH